MKKIAVDASCTRTQIVYFRGVDMETGEELFRRGPYHDCTIGIGETLAVVLGLAWAKQQNLKDYVVFSDSQTAVAWVSNRKLKSNLKPTDKNEDTFKLIEIADRWLQDCPLPAIRRVLKWHSDKWGENPADFGNKKRKPCKPKTKKITTANQRLSNTSAG